MKESEKTQFQSVFLKSGGYGPEIYCAASKSTLKSRAVLHFYQKQLLLYSNWDKYHWKWRKVRKRNFSQYFWNLEVTELKFAV